MWEIAAFAAASVAAARLHDKRTRWVEAQIDIKVLELKRSVLSHKKNSTGRCLCCGSQDFKKHNGRLICTYCRNGTAIHQEQTSEITDLDQHRPAPLNCLEVA